MNTSWYARQKATAATRRYKPQQVRDGEWIRAMARVIQAGLPTEPMWIIERRRQEITR